MVHVDLIGPHSKCIRQHHPVGAIIKHNVSFTRIKLINLTTCWFEIVKVQRYELDDFTGSTDEYIDK